MSPQRTNKYRWLAVARANSKVYAWATPIMGVLVLAGTTLTAVSIWFFVAGLFFAVLVATSQILQTWWTDQEAERRLQKAEREARSAYNAAVYRHTILTDQLDPVARLIALMADQNTTDRAVTFQRVVTQAVNSIMLAIAHVPGLRAVVYEVSADGQTMQTVSWNARTHRAAPRPFDRGGARGDAAFALLATGDTLFVPDVAAAPEKWAGSGVGYNTFISSAITSPPASSGMTSRYRLNRGGDRRANNALHDIAVVRLHVDPATRRYAQRRTTEGKTKKDILRCLKRAIAREVYHLIVSPPAAIDPTELRALRAAAGITLQQAATVLGCSIQKLSYLERGLTQNRQFMTTYREYLTTRDPLPNAA